MYKVLVYKKFTKKEKKYRQYHYNKLQEKTLIATEEELRGLTTLALEGDYEIISAHKISELDIPISAKEFLSTIRKKLKPKDLVFGIAKKEIKDLNYKKELDIKIKKEKK